MTTMVRARASGTGTPLSISPTRVRAANSTMTPWAKLKTPEALKIRTKPRATREYISPAAMPPMSTSTRKAPLPAMSTSGATKTAWRSSIMSDPEVGIHHDLILPDDFRRAIGDLPAIVEHDHPVRDVHDHAHVVLDKRDGGAELVVHVEDEARHVLLLLDVHARHGLVQEEQMRLGGKGPCQLHPLLQPVGQAACRRLANGLYLEKVDDALHGRPVLELLAPRRSPVHRVEEEVPTHLEQAPRHNVVEDAHALEKSHVLEGARDAEGGHVDGLEPGAVLSLEENPSCLRVIEAADGVEERRLPCSVGADDGDDLPAMDVHAHLAQGLDGPEAHGDRLDTQERFRARVRPGARGTGHHDRRRHQAPSTSMIRTWRSVSEVRPSS